MKYIRTTDGRIINTQDERGKLIGESIVKINNSLIVVKNNKGNELIPIKDIIKQADTIEKLCDFVDIQFDDGTWETYSYENEFKIKLLFKKAKQVFYGIRTDKGLIYVAKMNEKGELELL